MTFEQFCERLPELRLDRSGGLIKPYKPVLLAAVVTLIHKGKISTRNIILDGGLKSAYFQLLAALYPNWQKTTKVEYPFRHLENDGIWRLVPVEGASEALLAAKRAHAEAWDVLKHVQCAQLDEQVFAELAGSPASRFRVLQILAQTYFPPATSGILWSLMDRREQPLLGRRLSDADNILEKALEEHLESHWAETPFARQGVLLSRPDTDGRPGRQVLTPVNSIDLLGFHRPRKEWWVFELKRGRAADAVVGQVSRYLGWIGENPVAPGQTAVGVVIARRADPKLRYAVKSNSRLSLFEFNDQLELSQVG